ncbi:MAG: hypothetical protein HKL90_10075 [Elusimicrobia bacterium]|nr:hypothetical protein [Elusimicrobiota bacterium]
MRPFVSSTLLTLVFAASSAAGGVASVPDVVAAPETNSGSASIGGGSFGLGAVPLSPTPALSLAAPLAQVSPLPSALSVSAAASPAFAAVAAPSLPTEAARAAPAQAPPHIVFDVRGSRGGNGDVAAAYLTAYDLLSRTRGRADAVVPTLTFVTGELERRILSRLVGRPLDDGASLFDGGARVVQAYTPAKHEPADVLLNLAAHHGEFDRQGHIPVREGGVIVTQTVFGNTESETDGPATALVGGKRLEMSTAGLARKDAGIYADPVARELRGQPREQIARFVRREATDSDVNGAAAIGAVLNQEVLNGAEVGLAYGIGMAEVKPQFERYLAGLSNRAAARRGSYVIFTPSSFKLSDIKHAALRARVVVFNGDVPLPERAQAGTVYVVKTGTLPHRLFVGLMAYSRPPPLLAGDGAMSAAVGLGRPFVMTKVPWNEKNIAVYAERLAARAPAADRALLRDVYQDLKLERASELEALAPAYAATSRSIPLLTDTLFEAVHAARGLNSPGVPTDALLGGVKDEVLRASLVTHRSLKGDPDALEIAFETLRRGSANSRGLLVEALTRDLTRRLSFLRPLIDLNILPINALAARLTLTVVAAFERSRSAPRGTSPTNSTEAH